MQAHLGELGSVPHDVLVGGHQHIELKRGNLLGELASPLFLLPNIVYTPHRGQPLVQLGLPVHHDGIGHNDQVRAIIVFVLHQIRQQCHDLQQKA